MGLYGENFKSIFSRKNIDWQEYLDLNRRFSQDKDFFAGITLCFANYKLIDLEKITDKEGFVLIRGGSIQDFIGAYTEKVTRFVEKEEAERFKEVLCEKNENRYINFGIIGIK